MSLLEENENQFIEKEDAFAQDISNSTFKNITDIELIEGVKKGDYLPAKTIRNGKDIYAIHDALLSEFEIPHTKYQDYLIVDKKDKELAEKAIKAVSSKSDAEIDSFEKDKASFINKVVAEIKQYEYELDVLNSEIRSSPSSIPTPDKPLIMPSNYPKEIDSKTAVDIKEKFNPQVFEEEVAKFAPEENIDDERSEAIAEETRIREEENTPSLIDIYNAAAYGVDDDGNIMSPDYEERSIDNDKYDN